MIIRLTRGIQLASIILLLSACSRTARLEELNIVYGVAFDSENAGSKFKATYHIPFYKKESADNVTVTVSGDSSKETQGLAELQLDGKLGDDKVKLILIDQKLAPAGIGSLLQPFIKDRRVPVLLKIAITERPADSFLQITDKRFDPSTRISNIIKENERQNVLPVTSLQQFLNDWTNPGEDPYLPLISMEKNKPSVSGIALFKDAKYVEALRGYDNILLFAALQRSVPNAKYKFYWKGNRITARIKENSVHYKWNPNAKPPRMDINAVVKAILSEQPHPLDPPTHAEFRGMEKAFGEDMSQKIDGMLRSFQLLGIDPAGIGSIARSKQRNWQLEKWIDVYPKVQYRVNVKVRFIEDEM